MFPLLMIPETIKNEVVSIEISGWFFPNRKKGDHSDPQNFSKGETIMIFNTLYSCPGPKATLGG